MRWLIALILIYCQPGSGGEPVKNAPLVNQEGKPFQLHDLKGGFVLVSFVFTRCPLPKMCPLAVTRNKALLSQWKKQGGKPPLKLLLVTLDPDFDTPTVLKKFAKDRGLNLNHVVLATGNPQALSDFAAEFNVIGIPGAGQIAHNMKSILLGSNLVEIRQYHDNEWTADQVLRDLRQSPKL